MQSSPPSSPGSRPPGQPLIDDEHFNLPALASREGSLSPPYAPNSPSPDIPDDSSKYWRDHVQEIPFLPDPRPRVLTPLGFRDDEPATNGPLALCQSSSWFKVPLNIRRHILRLAFGDRRLHISLTYWSRNRESKDTQTTAEWDWSGRFCNRPELPGQLPAYVASDPNDRKATRFFQRNIGAMGWLLSCRQNYAEGIDVLYSTNAIFMSGEAMILHISRLLLPQRLAHMTYIEIRWPIRPAPSSKFKLDDNRLVNESQRPIPDPLDLDHLRTGLDVLSPKRFPSLRRLYMSFEKSYYWKEDAPCESYVSILQSLQDIVKARDKPLDECTFAFEAATYKGMTSSTLTDFPWRHFIHVWHDLEGNLHPMRIPYRGSYPKPPYHLGNKQKRGFWIVASGYQKNWPLEA
ncbi:hypothetical protein NXS19_011027 [Fusarium pseudograminearum]|nr:hypothetical protein NXS19_011027 [Fusarium pseudograminearum]